MSKFIFSFLLFQCFVLQVTASSSADTILLSKSSSERIIFSSPSNLTTEKQKLTNDSLPVTKEVIKKKKSIKSKAKLLSVFTFISRGLSLILSVIAVVMGMTGSAGTLLVLGIAFALSFTALGLGYFALKNLKKWKKEGTSRSYFYDVLVWLGVYAALIPIGFVVTVFLLILLSLAMGEIN